MAKVKKTKTSRSKLSSAAKRNLFVVGVLLICVGILLFVLDHKKQKAADFMGAQEPVAMKETNTLSPSEGCKLIATNYVCDIKVTNPSDKALEWSSVVTGMDSASLSNGGYGSVPARQSAIVQLTVPKAFCDEDPEGAGSILILEDAKSSNQAETKFTCLPASSIPEDSVSK